MVCISYGTKLCGMLITYVCGPRLSGPRPLVASTWGAVFRIATTTTRYVRKRGYFPNLIQGGRLYPHVSLTRGVRAPTPLLTALIHPLYSDEEKNLSGWLGVVQEVRQALQILIGVDLTENLDLPVGAKQSVPFS